MLRTVSKPVRITEEKRNCLTAEYTHPKKAKKDNKTAARLSGNNLAALPYMLYLLT